MKIKQWLRVWGFFFDFHLKQNSFHSLDFLVLDIYRLQSTERQGVLMFSRMPVETLITQNVSLTMHIQQHNLQMISSTWFASKHHTSLDSLFLQSSCTCAVAIAVMRPPCVYMFSNDMYVYYLPSHKG